MSRKQFDRFMVSNDNGRNLKWSRFTDGEFRALIQGILPIASMATPRGAFMVGGQPATADDVAFLAPKVTKRTAQRAIDRMRELGMLERDDEIGGEWIHDWDLLNPTPKADRTNAERQRRFRERRNAESNGVTTSVTPRDVTPPEVKKEEVEDTPLPPQGEFSAGSAGLDDEAPSAPSKQRKTEVELFERQMRSWALRNFPSVENRAVLGAVAAMRSHSHDEPVTPARLSAFLRSPAGRPYAAYFEPDQQEASCDAA